MDGYHMCSCKVQVHEITEGTQIHQRFQVDLRHGGVSKLEGVLEMCWVLVSHSQSTSRQILISGIGGRERTPAWTPLLEL